MANIHPEFPLARHTARVMVAGIAAALSFQSKVHMAFHSPPSQSSTRGSRKLLAGLSGVWAALAAVATAAAQAPAAQAPADLALLHGRIHTEDAGRSVVQALAVRGNTIVAVGADQAVTALI